MSTFYENTPPISGSIFDLLNEYEKSSAKIKGLIAGIIANKRNELNMNQKNFAKYLGVSQSMISKWESCEYNFTIDSLMSLLEKLELSFSVCIDGMEISSDKNKGKKDIGLYTKNNISGWNISRRNPLNDARGAA